MLRNVTWRGARSPWWPAIKGRWGGGGTVSEEVEEARSREEEKEEEEARPERGRHLGWRRAVANQG